MAPKNELFNREVECKIIVLVKNRPLLWDTTCVEYRRTDLKNQHWDEIAHDLGPLFTGEMVHKRFQNMERTYRANERKVRDSMRSGSGTQDIYKPTWDYYPMLSYLKKTCNQGDSQDNIRSPSPATPRSASNPGSASPDMYFDENTQQVHRLPPDTLVSDESESIEEVISEQPVQIIERNGQPGPSHTRNGQPPRPSSAPAPGFKRPRVEDEEPLFMKRGSKDPKKSAALEAVKVLKKLADDETPPPNLDRFDLLGSYIAQKLRAMPDEKASYYEEEITKALFKPMPNTQ